MLAHVAAAFRRRHADRPGRSPARKVPVIPARSGAAGTPPTKGSAEPCRGHKGCVEADVAIDSRVAARVCRVSGDDVLQLLVVQRRDHYGGITDVRQSQKASTNKVGRVVAARQYDAPALVFRHHAQQVSKRVSRGLLEQPFDTLDQQDLPALTGENRLQHGRVRRDLAILQRFVQMGGSEFLSAEAECKMIGRQNADGILRDA